MKDLPFELMEDSEKNEGLLKMGKASICGHERALSPYR
jgi:hypothetical protein